VREFETGATRDTADDKPDYEGCLSPLVLERYAKYMLKHSETSDGWRASDNWQKGIPLDAYMKSTWRHFMMWWSEHRLKNTLAYKSDSTTVLEEAICGLLFNAMGYLHEHLKEKILQSETKNAPTERKPTTKPPASDPLDPNSFRVSGSDKEEINSAEHSITCAIFNVVRKPCNCNLRFFEKEKAYSAA
jgi:hypothetical protein